MIDILNWFAADSDRVVALVIIGWLTFVGIERIVRAARGK